MPFRNTFTRMQNGSNTVHGLGGQKLAEPLMSKETISRTAFFNI
jgi:hypothetical protein